MKQVQLHKALDMVREYLRRNRCYRDLLRKPALLVEAEKSLWSEDEGKEGERVRQVDMVVRLKTGSRFLVFLLRGTQVQEADSQRIASTWKIVNLSTYEARNGKLGAWLSRSRFYERRGFAVTDLGFEEGRLKPQEFSFNGEKGDDVG